jgi:magnesium transporter
MINSFIFSEGRLVGRDLDLDALRLVQADKGLMVWVDLADPTKEEIVQVLEEIFKFHPLAIEDCLTPGSLPKIEDYDDYLFVVAHGVDFSNTEEFSTTELDLFIGKEFLVTFHRKPLRSVQVVSDRCVKATGVVARGPDRLAHMVLDVLSDNYKPVTDRLRSELESLEQQVLGSEKAVLNGRFMELRSQISHLRKIIRPQRDVAGRLARGDSKMIRSLMLPYFRDLRDNLIRIDETAAGFADQMLISFDLHLSRSSFEANDGIKALTAITAISLPATVIGSWYGMNFAHMPELESPVGYYTAAVVTLVLTVLTWIWCKRRGWI